jgi:hypothetical protein
MGDLARAAQDAELEYRKTLAVSLEGDAYVIKKQSVVYFWYWMSVCMVSLSY